MPPVLMAANSIYLFRLWRKRPGLWRSNHRRRWPGCGRWRNRPWKPRWRACRRRIRPCPWPEPWRLCEWWRRGGVCRKVREI